MSSILPPYPIVYKRSLKNLKTFKLINLYKTMNTTINTSSAMSICIPRAFANITEARVRKVFDALHIFQIDHIDMVQRKNEKGELFQRIFVHIKEWSKTAEADKARERLCSGKELKIVYDDPWFWKVALNTWTPKPQVVFKNDRKPRIRIDFDEDNETKNIDAATNLLSNMSLNNDQKDDRRPYSERRLNAEYCEQDVKSGFKDRRKPRDDRRPYSERRLNAEYCEQDVKSGFKDRRRNDDRRPRDNQGNDGYRPRDDDRRPRDDDRRPRDDGYRPRDNSYRHKEEKAQPLPKVEPVVIVAPPLPKVEPVVIVAPVIKPKSTLVKDRELVIRMQQMFRCEITDEIYLNNRQKVTELIIDTHEDNVLPDGMYVDDIHINYGEKMVAPKKKIRKII